MSGPSSPEKDSISQSSVILFDDREDKTEEARRTYVDLEECVYFEKHLGDSRTGEFMECDCVEDFKDGDNHACDEHSDCINRLTLIECVNKLCTSCGDDCNNQRFQKRQYANISVFQTEKKGYGIRAGSTINSNTLIYEYIGEVISEDEFRNRMVNYDMRGIKHFYFMMLQTGEFVDATERGSLARFCNHSCNPNTYVSKWDVAGKLRMGIFAKRSIMKGEEITFDYNVDRYGATAQPCYCGEPNCMGFLGGKTQTDAASLLPQNYADALGVTPSMEKKWLKMKRASGESIKKDNSNINFEFVESLKLEPCLKYCEVCRVMSVLLQTDDEFICSKLLERILITTEENMQYQIIKLHGYQCFHKLLTLFNKQYDTVSRILTYLSMLPKTTKNGIVLSQIDKKVESFSKNPELEPIASKILQRWNQFETYKRIAKRDPTNSESASGNKLIDLRRIRLPSGWEIIHENGRPLYYDTQRQRKQGEPPIESGGINSTASSTPKSTESYYERKIKRPLDPDFYEKRKKQRMEWEIQEVKKRKEEEVRYLKEKLESEKQKQSELEQIIAEANKQKENQRFESLQKENGDLMQKKKSKQFYLANKLEHEWTKYFASIVPNLIKPYESKLERIRIKECARDIVKILTTKELKKDPKKIPPSEVTIEKKKKVKEFCKGYMEKFLVKLERKRSSK